MTLIYLLVKIAFIATITDFHNNNILSTNNTPILSMNGSFIESGVRAEAGMPSMGLARCLMSSKGRP